MEKSIKTVAQNKKALHDYFVEERLECGIELLGTEVKSVRQGKVNLKDSYCRIIQNELFVMGMHVSPYEQGNVFNKDPLRVRKLLVHKKEIEKLNEKVAQDGYSLVPLSVYFKNGKVKIQLSIAKGKKNYDKRDVMAKNDAKRKIERALKEMNK